MIHVQTLCLNPIQENTYIVYDDTKEAVIIDCGALFEGERQAVTDFLTEHQLTPVAHLLTHAHFDHLFGSGYLYEHYGLKARFHQADAELFDGAQEQVVMMIRHQLPFTTGPAGEAVTSESIIRFGNHEFTVLPCPGHTQGGVCYYCKDEKILFSGDSLFQQSIGRTDLPGGNYQQLIRSLSTLLSSLPDDITVYPGHGPATTTGQEKALNPYI